MTSTVHTWLYLDLDIRCVVRIIEHWIIWMVVVERNFSSLLCHCAVSKHGLSVKVTTILIHAGKQCCVIQPLWGDCATPVQQLCVHVEGGGGLSYVGGHAPVALVPVHLVEHTMHNTWMKYNTHKPKTVLNAAIYSSLFYALIFLYIMYTTCTVNIFHQLFWSLWL